MTLPLPVYDGTNAQFIFDLIAQAFIDTGGRASKVRFGSEAISLAAAMSGTATVAHGMGSTPVVVVATPASNDVRTDVSSFDATDFTLRITSNTGGALTATYTSYWIAIG